MLAAGSATDAHPDFFRWVPHPEVWLLVIGVTVLYVYAIRVIGPKVVPSGTPAASRQQLRWFTFGILALWVAADWPVHDIGEDYLYLVHMLQHLTLTLIVPPVMLLATPEWLARLVIGQGRAAAVIRWLARPVPAGAIFGALTLVTHAPIVVNTASDNAVFHYSVHVAIVTSALLFWMPVCGPLPELRISLPAQMIYLFVQSLVPTVPGGWLVFAEGAVYSTYDIPGRLWGISVTSDQQVAGMEMKLLAGTYLWVLIAMLFFRWSAQQEASGNPTMRDDPAQPLTYEAVQREFDEHPAPAP